MREHEVAPGGDDSRGIPADLRHVSEADAVGVAAECLPESVQPRTLDDDQRRVAGIEAVPDERGRLGDERVLAAVQEHLVAEAVHLAPLFPARAECSPPTL